MKKSALLLLLICTLCLLNGCGGSAAEPPPHPIVNPPSSLTNTSLIPPTWGGGVGQVVNHRFVCLIRGGSTSSCLQGEWRDGFPLTASGGIEPYKWTWAAAPSSSLPPGLSITTRTYHKRLGYGNYLVPYDVLAIAGIPTQAGDFNVVVSVTDSASPPAHVSTPYTIHIGGFLFLDSTAPSVGAINLPYSFTFRTNGTSGAESLTWTETGALPPGLTFNTGTVSGTPTATGSFPITLTVRDPDAHTDTKDYTILVAEHGFTPTGSMASPRMAHTATLLDDGKVLVAGGGDPTGNVSLPCQSFPSYPSPLSSAELFDPAGSFSSTGDMTTPRVFHTATLLPGGKVLVAGGRSCQQIPLASAELYDPATGKFSPTGNMTVARANHTATLLDNGKVLITGGDTTDSTGDVAVDTAELYDPNTGTFSLTAGSMTLARSGHTATKLKTGKALIAGGRLGTWGEVFDPADGTFSQAGNLDSERINLTANLLNTGQALVAGGFKVVGFDAEGNPILQSLASAELFDPATGAFSLTGSLSVPRESHTATLLPDGTTLIAGGTLEAVGLGVTLSSAELFDPAKASFTRTGDMTVGRQLHTATLLKDGRVLIVGGTCFCGSMPGATAELYQ